ncbi:MFS transporter [Helicobacter anatolicus]|uniref:MFS transporter n=1 Tax=Helicobacter anatolicus TaxID=2905874 RepID=UPI001E58E8E8|nr:MFS transporter [Helicobacter anatolicus]MCE3039203.1 MFS transporter [Helicobacter anatolicus]
MFKQIFPLVSIVVLRFFGLFIILPIISLYANEFHNASPLMIGLVVGGAYLTQLIFQTPLGILSDRYNRKIIIFIGLLIFFIGSIICALAQDIYILVLGRIIQGIGAIGGIVSAQITDITKEEERTKAMAIMGGGIFLSFILAMILGPLIGVKLGASWLFALTAFLTFLSMILLLKTQESPKLSYSFEHGKTEWIKSFQDKNLWIMYLSSFLEKALMTLIFVIIPLALVESFDFNKENLWQIYLPSAIIGIFAMGPASILAEKYNKAKLVLFIGISCFILSYFLIAFSLQNLGLFIGGVLIFFVGFAILEPIMQSLASKYAKAHLRGAALGNFTTASYLGSFVGGVFGAILYHDLGLKTLAFSVVILCAIWLLIIFCLKAPQKQKNLYIPLNSHLRNQLKKIANLQGIIETYINENEKIIIIKYNSDFTNPKTIQENIKNL